MAADYYIICLLRQRLILWHNRRLILAVIFRLVSHMLRILSLCLLLSLQPAIAADTLSDQRDLFQRVEHDLKRGVRSSYLNTRDVMKDYPLYPYLVYLDVKRRLAKVSDETVISLLHKYDDSVISDYLRYRWLQHRSRSGHWAIAPEYYIPSPYLTDESMPCHHAHALLKHGRAREAREQILSLWLVNFSQPAACDPVFAYAKENGIIGDEETWQRILLVIEKRRMSLANYLARGLSSGLKRHYRLLQQAYHNPLRILSQADEDFFSSPYRRDIFLYAIKRERKKNFDRAATIWVSVRRQAENYASFQDRVHYSLGLFAALQLEAERGYRYLSHLSSSAHTPESRYWLIRSALRLYDWNAVLRSIDMLPDDKQSYPQWMYWRARALEQTGRSEQAREILRALAQRSNYYGYLAADRIGAIYRLEKSAPDYTRQSLKEIENLPAVRRIREFILLKRWFDARREMNYLVGKLGKTARMRLAVLCRQWNWSSGVVQALAADTFRGETNLRFPLPWRDLVARESGRSGLPEHWLYGVMRRESAFMPQIKSPVGAIGVMQLMPRTARSVAKRLRIKAPSKARLTDTKLNLQLGASYLAHLYKMNNQHLPLSLAAYNAGPSRVKVWLRRTPVRDADIWIDTIPFDETRLYVRAVLFYMTVYQYKLQARADRLKTLLSIG